MSKKKVSDRNVTIIVSIVLLLTAVCLLVFLHADRIGKYIGQHMDVLVEIDDNLKLQDREQIEAAILQSEGVIGTSIQFTSKKEGVALLKEEYLNGIEIVENPLKDIFTFNIEAVAYTSGNLEDIKDKLLRVEGVSGVYYENLETQMIKDRLMFLAMIILLLSAVFGVLAILLIINTIKLRLYADRMEIKTMQTVGAKSSFIKKPYLHRAIDTGIRSAIYASMALIALLVLVHIYLPELGGLISWVHVVIVFIVLFSVAVFLMLLVTNGQVNKYIKQAVDVIL